MHRCHCIAGIGYGPTKKNMREKRQMCIGVTIIAGIGYWHTKKNMRDKNQVWRKETEQCNMKVRGQKGLS